MQKHTNQTTSMTSGGCRIHGVAPSRSMHRRLVVTVVGAAVGAAVGCLAWNVAKRGLSGSP